MWLIGLGVDPIWSRPRCPEEDAEVERAQGVTQQRVEPGRGRPRPEAYPAPRERRRPYTRGGEEAGWDRTRVDGFLSRGVWRRRVSGAGPIALYNRSYRVGRRHAGQEVSVRCDAAGRHWVVEDARGQELARHAAEQITRDRVMGPSVMHRRISKRADPSAKPRDGGPLVQPYVG